MKMYLDGELSDFRSYYLGLESCCLQPEDKVLVDQSTKLIGFIESVPDEESGFAITRLENGRWVVFIESQDYTGHG